MSGSDDTGLTAAVAKVLESTGRAYSADGERGIRRGGARACGLAKTGQSAGTELRAAAA